MTTSRLEIVGALKKLLHDVPGINKDKIDNLTVDSDLVQDLELPSSDIVMLIADVEDHFEIAFEDDDVDELGSKVSDVVELVIRTIESKDSQQT